MHLRASEYPKKKPLSNRLNRKWMKRLSGMGETLSVKTFPLLCGTGLLPGISRDCGSAPLAASCLPTEREWKERVPLQAKLCKN